MTVLKGKRDAEPYVLPTLSSFSPSSPQCPGFPKMAADADACHRTRADTSPVLGLVDI